MDALTRATISLPGFNEDATDVDIRCMTPRSATALRRHGIQPNELLRRPTGFFATLPEFRGKSLEAIRVAAEIYESNRQRTLAAVRNTYDEILSSSNSGDHQTNSSTSAPVIDHTLPSSARRLPATAQKVILRERSTLLRREEAVATQLREKLVERMVDDRRRKLRQALNQELQEIESQLKAHLDAFFWRISTEDLASDDFADRAEVTVISNQNSVSDAFTNPESSDDTPNTNQRSTFPRFSHSCESATSTSVSISHSINLAKLLVQQLPKIPGIRLSLPKPLGVANDPSDSDSTTISSNNQPHHTANKVLVEVTSIRENPNVAEIVSMLCSTSPSQPRPGLGMDRERDHERDPDVDDMISVHRRNCDTLVRDCLTRLRQRFSAEQKQLRRELAREAQLQREQQLLKRNMEMEEREKQRAQRLQRNVEMHSRALEAQQRLARERADAMRERVEQANEMRRLVIEERTREADERRAILEAKRKSHGVETLVRQQEREGRTKRLQASRLAELEEIRQKEQIRQQQQLARSNRLRIEREKIEERARRLAEVSRQRIEEIKLEQEERNQARAQRLEMRQQRSEAQRALNMERKARQNEIRSAAQTMHQALLRQAQDRRRQADEFSRQLLREKIAQESEHQQQKEIESRYVELEKTKLHSRVNERIRMLETRVDKLCKSSSVGELLPLEQASIMSIDPRSLVALEEKAQASARIRRREIAQQAQEAAANRSRSQSRSPSPTRRHPGDSSIYSLSPIPSTSGLVALPEVQRGVEISSPSMVLESDLSAETHSASGPRRHHKYGQAGSAPVSAWDAGLTSDQIYADFVQPVNMADPFSTTGISSSVGSASLKHAGARSLHWGGK